MKYLAVLLLFLVGVQSALAYDIPAPRPRAKPEVKADDETANREEKKNAEPSKKLAELQRFTIQIDEKAKKARLVIPNSVIRELQAADGKSGAFIPSDFPGTLNDNQPLATRIGTVVGGLLMTLAAVLGGLWFLRSRKVTAAHNVAVAILVLVCGVGTASYVYANAGPPPEARSLTSKALKFDFVTGEVQVETTNDADQIVLILPK